MHDDERSTMKSDRVQLAEALDEIDRLREALRNVQPIDDTIGINDADKEWFDGPWMTQVKRGDKLVFDDFEQPGTFVALSSEAFEPTDDPERIEAVMEYAAATGHNVQFVYKDRVRTARIYDVVYTGLRTRLVEGYDLTANDGRGGYRTFRTDRIQQCALVDPGV